MKLFGNKSKRNKILKNTPWKTRTEIFIEDWQKQVNDGPSEDGYVIISYYQHPDGSTPICIHISPLLDYFMFPLLINIKEMKKGFLEITPERSRFIYRTGEFYLEIWLEEVPNKTFFKDSPKLSKNLLCAEATRIIFRKGARLYEKNFIPKPNFVSNFEENKTKDYFEFLEYYIFHKYSRKHPVEVFVLVNKDFDNTNTQIFFGIETEKFLQVLKEKKPWLLFNFTHRITMTEKGMKAIWDIIHEHKLPHSFPSNPNRLYLVPVQTRYTYTKNGNIMKRKERRDEILAFCANGSYQLLDYEPQRFTDDSISKRLQPPVPISTNLKEKDHETI